MESSIAIEQILSEAEALRRTPGRPLVTLSYAQSLDGSIAARRGAPLVISGPESLQMTHALRAAHDAILVGIGTILADNPQLSVRLVDGQNPQPVVMDTHLRFPTHAKLLHGKKPPWIATSRSVDKETTAGLEKAGAQLLYFETGEDGRVPFRSLLEMLGNKGVSRLMVEGGARVITTLLAGQLVDLVVLTIAPIFVGGLRALEPKDLSFAPAKLQHVGYTRLGDDLIVWGTLR